MTDLLDRDDTTTATRARRSLVIGGLVVVVLLGGAIWWFFLRDDSPVAFDIEGAVAGAVDTVDDQRSDDPPTRPEGVDGTWTVEPGTGGDAAGSAAGFRVAEELVSVGATEAVGRTSRVNGSLTIEGTTVTSASITVDMGSLRTDDSRRDGRMRSALATEEFPTSSFVLTEPIELGSIPAEGATISVTAIGEMTIKGATNPVEVALDAQVVEGTLVLVGSLPVVFADYGVEPPSAAIVVSVEDRGTVEFQLFLARA